MCKKIFFSLLVVCNCVLSASNPINYQPKMTQYLMSQNVLEEDKFFLFDVGASHGIAKHWKSFGDTLSGVGFEPLIDECERLNSINEFPNVTYVSSFIISEIEEMDKYKRNLAHNPFIRSSSMSYRKNLNLNYIKESFNHGVEPRYTDQKISLDRYCIENNITNVDFIKIDTDGGDYAVLKGAEKLLQDGNVLGLLIESQFHGDDHPFANTFRNIDVFLIRNGFSLFDLSTWKYTRAALPGKFFYAIPAQTTNGQLCWGDALYLKDLVTMKKQGKEIPTSQIIKMACLQEIFGLSDCAAELLLTFQEQLSQVIDINECLNALTRDVGLHPDYETHMNTFLTNPQAFFPENPTPPSKPPREKKRESSK